MTETVYEQSIVGNDSMLAVIGGRGELRYLFYPTKSFPQNIHSSLPGIYRRGYFSWLTDWSDIKQRYAAPGILETVFKSGDASVKVMDFVLHSESVLIRRFEFSIPGEFSFIYYTSPQLWETHNADAAYFDERYGAIVDYKRGLTLVVSGDRIPNEYQIGQLGADSDAFTDAYDGRLNMNKLSIYEGFRGVNFALLWRLRDNETLTIYFILDKSEEAALRELAKIKSMDCYILSHSVAEHWEGWINKIKLNGVISEEMIKHSAYVIKMLQDSEGAFIAAPTLWPDYRYCWPRDAAYSAMALDILGYHDEAFKFINWVVKSQGENGAFYQRYYAEPGLKAPSWSFQIDETASVVLATYVHFKLTLDRQFLKNAWVMVRKAAEYLAANVSDDGLTTPTVGPWEEHLGVHTYTNASVYAALSSASYLAGEIGDRNRAVEWGRYASVIRSTTLNQAWNGSFFIKIIKPRFNIPDSATLGLVFPFNMVNVNDDRVKMNAETIEKTFKYKVGGVGRNPEDKYYGGNPWIITTLWLAIYHKLAGNVDKANELIKWALTHSTSTGMLPEQVDKDSGRPISAIPLAWSHAMYIMAEVINNDLFNKITPPLISNK
ncbi:glycoside hydrolase family 15 protein [Caldivirga maquilingensis]|uniref:Glycoside hydrolase 15-related n=1 Tax=Caldivirga maquilingensis (strain ATCC 700844 / DSM 13496 / JCM 10307 / IC-167) TaxID=397948 RepID=A8M9R3_CALMQ|nr:glycoside hydrolase family 15 protein [Caldivirga maquilingensis]ABW00944.1 glycoside hydrolase 15-related [Caldivirga maquilingensis IC-167]